MVGDSGAGFNSLGSPAPQLTRTLPSPRQPAGRAMNLNRPRKLEWACHCQLRRTSHSHSGTDLRSQHFLFQQQTAKDAVASRRWLEGTNVALVFGLTEQGIIP